MTAHGDCRQCEERLQPYLDRTLTADERVIVQLHLSECGRCARCYRLEEVLWKHVRNCCEEEVNGELASNGLQQRLAALRSEPS